MADLLLCLRIFKVDDVGGGRNEIYINLKPSNESLFAHSIHSEPRKPPTTHVVMMNEDFVVKLPQPFKSFNVEISIKEKHSLIDKVLAHGKLELTQEDVTTKNKIREGEIKVKGANIYYQYVVLEQSLPPTIKDQGYHITYPKLYLETGRQYYPGDTIRGLIALDNNHLNYDPESGITFSTDSKGRTFDVVYYRGFLGSYSHKNPDFRNYEVTHESRESFPLFAENLNLPPINDIYTVPFSFKIPLSTPISLPEVRRPSYFSEKVGRTVGEQMAEFDCRWDKLPVAKTSINVHVMGPDNKMRVSTQDLQICHPESTWFDSLDQLKKMSENLLSSVSDKIMPCSTYDMNEFITAEVDAPEFVRIGESFKVKVKIASKLSKKLWNVEVRVGTAADFTAKMVSINYRQLYEKKAENGANLRTTDLATVFRKTIPDFEVKEETKEAELEVTIPPACFPTLLPSMYPLLSSWNWIEVSIEKGATDDNTYSSGNKYFVVTKSIIVLPPSPTKVLPTPHETPINSPTKGPLLAELIVEPPKTVVQLPFMIPTTDGQGLISLHQPTPC